MESLLSRLYDKVICQSEESVTFGMRYDEIVTELVKPLYEAMDEEAVEEIRELIYSASYYAEKYGFYLGIHTAVQFMTEAMNILDEAHEQQREADMALFFCFDLWEGGDSIGSLSGSYA